VTTLQRWLRQPQTIGLRKALLQVHLWTGLAVGLYVVVICLSGSVLVYRNELYRTFSPEPVIVSSSGAALPADALSDAASRAYPDYKVTNIKPGQTSNHAVEITLVHGNEAIARLFDPFTGEDLGNPTPAGYRFTSWLLDFHDSLLAGETGRRVNGVGAVLVLLLCATGAVIWWPGMRTWRRSLVVDVRARSKLLIWSLHSALGFWFFAFTLLWGVTGTYLAFPDAYATVFDYVQPLDDATPERTVDRIQYWLAYLHFGRLGGRGIPRCGRGLCDSITKAIWAGAGLIPPVMFVTGALMWWNRVLRPRFRQTA
jgi:uncharacterized iron-regulated membrane protein